MSDLNSHQQTAFDDEISDEISLQSTNTTSPGNLSNTLPSDLNMSLSALPSSLQTEIMSSLTHHVYENMNSSDQTIVLNTSSANILDSSCEKTNNSFLLEESLLESLNFKEILQLFGCAISEEQAWAVLNQCLNELKYMMETNIELLHLNQDSIDINCLNFTKNGTILFDFDVKPSGESPLKLAIQQSLSPTKILQLTDDNTASNSIFWSSTSSSSSIEEKNSLEAKILKSVAYLIFDALDYGNSCQNEPDLKNSLQNLLVQMSGHFKEYTSNRLSEDDEGYDQEEDEVTCFDKALEICTSNVSEADYHYKAVCRGLYAQAYELKVFLAKIEQSKKLLKKSGKDPSNYSFEILSTTDWTKLWMQVIHELRNGVKLRKVSDHPYVVRRHIEYELTPFEILLDQIRAKKYQLKKLDKSMVIEQKSNNARDIILEFIRSRPPLKKSSLRKLKPRNIKLNMHDQLMISIRTYDKPLRKVPEKEEPQGESMDGSAGPPVVKKRLLKVDKKLLNNNFSSSDDDDSDIDYDELQNSSIFFQSDQYLFQSSYMPDLTDSFATTPQQKRSIKAPESLKSPLAEWSDPVEDWRALVTEDILTESGRSPSIRNLERRHTMNLTDTISNNLTSLNIFTGLTNSSKSKQINEGQLKKITSVEISLTFDELCHIRKVLTKNDLDYLLFDKQLYQEVSKGKICFSCRKSRFNWLNWGCKCHICQQRICKKCLRSVKLNNGELAQVPLSKLCPRKFSDSHLNDNTDTESHNSNSSICSQTTNDDSDQMVSSNEKLESTSTLSSVISKIDYQGKNYQLLNICVDCYQLMVSLKVKNSDDESFESNEKLNEQESIDKHQASQTATQNLVKFLQKKNPLASPLPTQKSMSKVESPETPVMNSMIHIKNCTTYSPLVGKLIAGNHSTPTPVALASETDFPHDEICANTISTIINVNEADRSQLPQETFTFDLNPIYADIP